MRGAATPMAWAAPALLVLMCVPLAGAAEVPDYEAPPQLLEELDASDIDMLMRRFLKERNSGKMLEAVLHKSCTLPDRLRFGLDGRNRWAFVCCDSNDLYAENAFLFLSHLPVGELKVENFTFYDPLCAGTPLFRIGKEVGGRSIGAWWRESAAHGWPSFRDREVLWSNVIERDSGEIVSKCGTHLGHNIPDDDGRDRYCINLICIAGERPAVRDDHIVYNVSKPAKVREPKGSADSRMAQRFAQQGDIPQAGSTALYAPVFMFVMVVAVVVRSRVRRKILPKVA